jgi:hypothetical protein
MWYIRKFNTFRNRTPHAKFLSAVLWQQDLITPFLWVMTVCHYITGSRCYHVTHCLRLYWSLTSKSFKLNALCSFPMSGTNYPLTQCHVPEEQPWTTLLWKCHRLVQYDSTAVYMSNVTEGEECLLLDILVTCHLKHNKHMVACDNSHIECCHYFPLPQLIYN